jgi:predicted AAA+ superfamily ATPase
LDDLAKLSAAKSYPRAFISAVKSPFTIDEVQHVPELLLTIKHRVDEDRTPVRFLLTGSAEVRGGSAVTESLTGQMRVLDLWWLSQSDIEGTEGDWLEGFWTGSIVASCKGGIQKQALIHRMLRSGDSVLSVAPDLHALRVSAHW